MRRLATSGDFEAVYTIYMHPEVIPFLGFDPMSQEDFRPVYDALLTSRCFYVFEVAGRVQGFYKATRKEGRARHVAYLATLAVAPEAKGSGLARAMVEDAIAKLQQAGVTRIELTVEADNPRAIAFYERLGFEHEGTMRAAYKRATDQDYVDERFMALVSPCKEQRRQND
jgi:putative acetyltransferase